MLNFDEKVKFARDLFDFRKDISDLKIIDFNSENDSENNGENIPAVCVYDDKKHYAVCVTNDGDVLIDRSVRSLDDLKESLKKAIESNFEAEVQEKTKKATCPICGNVTEFDSAKIPYGVKFSYKCSKCDFMHLVKFKEPILLYNKVQSTVNYFEKNIFTILNLNDPFWEGSIRNIANELISKLVSDGKNYHDILVLFNEIKDVSELEKLLSDNGVNVAGSELIKNTILDIFVSKIKWASELL